VTSSAYGVQNAIAIVSFSINNQSFHQNVKFFFLFVQPKKSLGSPGLPRAPQGYTRRKSQHRENRRQNNRSSRHNVSSLVDLIDLEHALRVPHQMANAGERVIRDAPRHDEFGTVMEPRRKTQTPQIVQVDRVGGRGEEHTNGECRKAKPDRNAGHSVGD